MRWCSCSCPGSTSTSTISLINWPLKWVSEHAHCPAHRGPAEYCRAHVYRIGDGGAHLHIWFFARPLGQGQLYGSWLPVWDDLLPEYPDDLAEQDAETVARGLDEQLFTSTR